MKMHRSERGQSLILIVLALVGFFGFAALSVDVGRVFAERRRAQNAADAAAYAAAMSTVNETDWATAALDQAYLNGYDDLDPNENLSQRVDVQVFHPAISGPYADPNRSDYDEYYQVFIRDQVDPVFAQFVFNGLLGFTVESVAHNRPARGMFPGDAMVATNTSACKAVWFQGSADTFVQGGNVFSNSDRTGRPASCDSGVMNGSGGLEVVDGGISTVGTFDGVGVTAEDGINTGVDHQDLPSLPIPDCSGLPQRTYTPLSPGDRGPNVLLPGYYRHGIKVSSGEPIELESGMYCLQDDFSLLGGSIHDVRNSTTGTFGVFIVMLDGAFNMSGNTVVNLNRMNAFTDPSGQDWHGMLMYMPDKAPWVNENEVHIGGSGASSYTGTIYAPGPVHSGYKCVIEGNGGSIGMASNIICNTIYITGSSSVSILYAEEQNFRMPPLIELSQ